MDKKFNNPNSRTQQGSVCSSLEILIFLSGIHHHICGISLVGSFYPLGPSFKSVLNCLIMIKHRITKITTNHHELVKYMFQKR